MVINALHKKNINHEKGSYITTSLSEYGYVPIPKNASKFANKYFRNQARWHRHLNFLNMKNDKKFIVFLREPLERWVSGMTEYIFRYYRHIDIKNPNYFINKKVFDEHTEFQSYFLEGIDLSNCIFFRVDNFLQENLQDFMKRNVKEFRNIKPAIIPEISPIKENMKTILRSFLEERKYAEPLEKFYQKDYDLYNNVNYYIKE